MATADTALRLVVELMHRRPSTAPRVLAAASELLRASLPIGEPLLGLQSTALHVVLTAMEAWGVHGGHEAALRGAHAMLAEDLLDLFCIAVPTQCVASPCLHFYCYCHMLIFVC